MDWVIIGICCAFTFILRRELNIFRPFEIFMFNFVFYNLLLSRVNQFLLIATIFAFFNKPVISKAIDLIFLYSVIPAQLNDGISMKIFLSLLNPPTSDVLYALFLILLFIAAQIGAYLLKNKNFARKNFHFLLFFLCLRNSVFYVQIFQILIYFSALLCSSNAIINFLSFLMVKNKKKDSFSHFFIICALTYPVFFLDRSQYIKLAISICILDSFASICGIYFKSKTKSFCGFFCGQITSWIAEFILTWNIDFSYHLAMGLIELLCPWNDNISLSFFSVIYQKLIALNQRRG